MMMQEGNDQAYDGNTLLKDLDSLLAMAKTVGAKYFGEDIVELIARSVRGEYERVIPLLPYVGGDKSVFTDLMIQSGQTIAFYKACKERNLPNRQIGELIYEIAEEQVRSVSRFKKWFARNLFFTRSYMNRWRRAMEYSQDREFTKNWVGEFVEGDGEDFDYGFDFLECGFLKLASEIGGLEVAPYVCLCDFARMHGIGVGFRRTQTLAMGHSRCDFRFSKDYRTPRGWPPESLDEIRNSPLEDVMI